MVDLADLSSKQLLTICTDPDDELLFLLAYLLQFRIYAENKLYEVAKTKTEQVKYALKQESRSSNIGKRLLNKSKPSQALLTGELPEETQPGARKHRKKLSISSTRNDTKSDSEESELFLTERKCKQHQRKPQTMKKSSTKLFAIQTKALDKELEAHANSKMMAAKVKFIQS
jgi:hypothetical protein